MSYVSMQVWDACAYDQRTYTLQSRSLWNPFAFLILFFWAFLSVFRRPSERLDANTALLCAAPDTVGAGEEPGLVAV